MSKSRLFAVLFRWKCTSTHHQLAMDALRHLRAERAERWQNLFLRHVEPYLAGATAPDDRFGDFKNHVLLISENRWGGPIPAAEAWYQKTLSSLKAKKWSAAVYSAGVLSHYYMDPLHPLHTVQSTEAGILRRAVGWAVGRNYLELQQILEKDLGGYPDVVIPAGADWLGKMIKTGAEKAHPAAQIVLDHFDLAKAVRQPASGMDQECRDKLAALVGQAVIGWARILDRLVTEAEVEPPRVQIGTLGVLATLTIPIFWLTRRARWAAERALVYDVHNEFQRTGKVIHDLPLECRTLRAVHAEEVLKRPLADLDGIAPRPLGSLFGTGAPDRRPQPAPKPVKEKPVREKVAPEPKLKEPEPKLKETAKPVADAKPVKPTAAPVAAAPVPPPVAPIAARSPATVDFEMEGGDLQLDSPIDQSPSIGSKAAGQLLQAGIRTVGDLLDADPAALLKKAGQRFLDVETIRQWQSQAALRIQVPGLSTQAVQLLVGSGIESASDLATSDGETLLELVVTLAESSAGQRILRDGPPPTLADVMGWIDSAAERSAAA